jgi:hypothetical protein
MIGLPRPREQMMSSKATGSSFKKAYQSFKSGIIDDTSVNTMKFGRAAKTVKVTQGRASKATTSGTIRRKVA